MLLSTENIVKQYTGHLALDHVSIQVPRGSVFGLLGPNGAGKTTLIRIINSITAPDSGKVIFDGHRLTDADTAHIGYLPEERGLYKKMKVGEQALYLARLKGLSRAEALERLKVWFRRFEIESWWDKKIEELSKGMAQKVQFVTTVIHEPKLLIFDEPFSGFDPVNAELLKDEILRLRDNGATVIFSTHNMDSVERLCQNIALINHSKVVLSGSVDEIRRNSSDHRYSLTIVAQQPDGVRLPDGVVEINRKVAGGSVSLECQLAPDQVNSTISHMMQYGTITHFDEKLPSMNDIFIATTSVNEHV